MNTPANKSPNVIQCNLIKTLFEAYKQEDPTFPICGWKKASKSIIANISISISIKLCPPVSTDGTSSPCFCSTERPSTNRYTTKWCRNLAACHVYRAYYWHSSLGTGFITASGFLLQPNIQEREFGHHAPSLTSLDPTLVRLFYLDLCRVAHEYGIHVLAYEEYRPEVTFSTIECGDTPTARVPKFCESEVPQWAAIPEGHLGFPIGPFGLKGRSLL